MKIQAAVIENKGDPFKITEIELDDPKQNEVLVKVAACGVCHTDEVARQQLIPVPLPAVLGHEGCGTIVKLGPGVTEFKVGDKVSFSYGYCGVCKACRGGHPYGCRENRRINFGGVQLDNTKRRRMAGNWVSSFFGQSAFATHAVVHVNNLIPAPDDVDMGILGPMGCGIQTGASAVLNYIKPSPAAAILITGCGPVGLSAVMAAKIAGCAKIIACDIVPGRLELAMELGATHTINSKEVPSVIDAVMELTGEGVEYAIDCTGNGVCVRQSLDCVRPLGTCVILGATQDVTFNVENELMGTCKTLVGLVEGFSIPQIFIPQLLEYYRKGMFPFDRLIKYYDFKDINQAFADTKSGEVIKAVLRME